MAALQHVAVPFVFPRSVWPLLKKLANRTLGFDMIIHVEWKTVEQAFRQYLTGPGHIPHVIWCQWHACLLLALPLLTQQLLATAG
jgi:hypothetical protein